MNIHTHTLCVCMCVCVLCAYDRNTQDRRGFLRTLSSLNHAYSIRYIESGLSEYLKIYACLATYKYIRVLLVWGYHGSKGTR